MAPELEARIVALLLGEASDFEKDELKRLIEERQDVRGFKDQMQAVYGLLEHAAGDTPLEVSSEIAGEEIGNDDLDIQWKLAEDKRANVLALFSDAEVSGTVAAGTQRETDLQGATKQPSLVPAALFQGNAEGDMSQGHVAVAHAEPLRILRKPWVWSAAACALLCFGGILQFGSFEDMAVSSLMMVEADSAVEYSTALGTPPSAQPEDAMNVDQSRLSAPQGTRGKSESRWFSETDEAEAETLSISNSEEAAKLGSMSDSSISNRGLAYNGRPASEIAPTAPSELFFGGYVDADANDEFFRSGEIDEDSRFSKEAFAEAQNESDAKYGFGYLGLKVERESESLGRSTAAGEMQPSRPSASTAQRDFSYSARQSNRKSQLGEEGLQKDRLEADGSFANGIVDGRVYSGKDVGGLMKSGELAIGEIGSIEMGMGGGGMGGGGMGGGGGGFAGGSVVDGKKIANKLQQQGQQQEGRSEASVDVGLMNDGVSLGIADPFGGEAKKADSSPESRSARGSSSKFAMPAQPSSPVSGPGPGILPPMINDSSGVQVLNDSEKRLSGLDPNDARLKRKEPRREVVGGRQSLDQLARVDSRKSKSKNGAGNDYSKQREIAIRGNELIPHASVPTGFPEIDASTSGFSTFSLHVSDVSFKLAQAALAKGEWPDAARIRSEEFLNAFDYGDPMPTQSERVSCRIEQSIHPFLQQRNLMRVSMRTAAAGRSSSTPLKLTFLLDNSGSMERIDRQQTVRRAFAVLTQQLKPMDEVTLISFARQPRLLADRVSGAQAQGLLRIIENLPSEGGTNLEAALQLAFEKAKEQYQENAQNRIILLTDGAVNLGDASPDQLSEMVVKMRSAGVAFDAAGISADGLNDEVLEALTRQGDGRYYLLDSLEAVEDGFAKQIAGALRPAAKNVKIQIEFNPERVGKYKLLGFEKHRLKKEDFRNDKVDAAEMAAAEAGVALYQVQAKPDGFGDIGTVSVRFRDLESGQMVEEVWPIPYETSALRPDRASSSMKIAMVASLLATKLKGDVLADTVNLKELANLISSVPPQIRNSKRVKQLEVMIQQARQLNGN